MPLSTAFKLYRGSQEEKPLTCRKSTNQVHLAMNSQP